MQIESVKSFNLWIVNCVDGHQLSSSIYRENRCQKSMTFPVPPLNTMELLQLIFNDQYELIFKFSMNQKISHHRSVRQRSTSFHFLTFSIVNNQLIGTLMGPSENDKQMRISLLLRWVKHCSYTNKIHVKLLLFAVRISSSSSSTPMKIFDIRIFPNFHFFTIWNRSGRT